MGWALFLIVSITSTIIWAVDVLYPLPSVTWFVPLFAAFGWCLISKILPEGDNEAG